MRAAVLCHVRRTFSTGGVPSDVAVLDAFRRYGHLRASLSPLLSARLGGDRHVDALPQRGEFPTLDALYCGTTAYEFSHCATSEERAWFAAAVESTPPQPMSPSTERNAASLMLRGAELEAFLARRFPGLKQYGGSGTESLLPCVEAIVMGAGAAGVKRVFIGQAHRGRLALLIALLNFPARKLFYKLDGNDEIPADVPGLDDVSSHIYATTRICGVHVSLLPNPSHLEAVNPVVMGRVRAAQDCGENALSLLLHGDGAFSGQGVVAECFSASKTPGFDVGGTVHVITNNLLAFTAASGVGRSSTYASDAAKIVDAPVIHVDAEDVPAVLRAAALATSYRNRFKRDVVIDLIGYRRYGHNEVDEPAFTSPQLYAEIRKRTTLAAAYGARVLGDSAAASIVARANAHFDAELTLARSSTGVGGSPLTASGGATGAGTGADSSDAGTHVVADSTAFGGLWSAVRPARSEADLLANPDTGASLDVLRRLGADSVTSPPGFIVHERLVRGHVAPRLAALAVDKASTSTVDWATAEALAFGLVLEGGHSVRLSGQDVERGTFSHRHAVFIDAKTGARAVTFPRAAGRFHVHSSLLSEEAVLGFEYGYSLANPSSLCIWEAQFGDFANSAQVVVDTFVATGETKWLRSSGLVLLLPHGQDGAGPEHSSARIERFLQLCNGRAWEGPHARVPDGKEACEPLNLIVAQPSTPANYFHLLRRQLARGFRKPLVVAAPKQLLRLAECTSALTAFAPGTRFEPVLGDGPRDPAADAAVQRVVICSGKLFFELDAARRVRKLDGVALIRVEELAPWPTARVSEELSRYNNAKSVVYAQDEPANAGGWSWARMHLPANVTYIGRPALAAAAVGLKKRHAAAQAAVVELALTT